MSKFKPGDLVVLVDWRERMSPPGAPPTTALVLEANKYITTVLSSHGPQVPRKWPTEGLRRLKGRDG